MVRALFFLLAQGREFDARQISPPLPFFVSSWGLSGSSFQLVALNTFQSFLRSRDPSNIRKQAHPSCAIDMCPFPNRLRAGNKFGESPSFSYLFIVFNSRPFIC